MPVAQPGGTPLVARTVLRLGKAPHLLRHEPTQRRLVALHFNGGCLQSQEPAVELPASAADHHYRGRAHAAVYISSVQFDSPGRDDRSNWSLNQEWVDGTNSTRRAVNLNGWTGTPSPSATSGWAVVPRSVSTLASAATPAPMFRDRRAYVWNNDYDTATLRNDRGRFVDDVSWGHHRGHRL